MARIKATYLLIDSNGKVTFCPNNAEESALDILDDADNEEFLIIDLEEGVYYTPDGVEGRITEHQFQDNEHPDPEELDNDD